MRLFRLGVIGLACSLAAAQTPRDDLPPDPSPAEKTPALTPYVLMPADRPWESPEFLACEIEFDIPAAEPDPTRPSLAAADAGLTRLERGSVLVFHSPGRAALASQIAELIDRQHRMLVHFTGQPIQSLPVVVVGAEEQLPRSFGFWVDIDGVTCWSLSTTEHELPLRAEGSFWADVGRAWLYHESLHECCHHGVCYDMRLMPHRWFCEGLSDYIGALAAVCYDPRGDRAHATQWIEEVRKAAAERATIDILDTASWWAPDGSRAPQEVVAYAAAQYSMARLVHEHGDAWIAPVFARVSQAPGPDSDTLIRIVEEETGAAHLEARLRAVPLQATLEYMLQGAAEQPNDAPADKE